MNKLSLIFAAPSMQEVDFLEHQGVHADVIRRGVLNRLRLRNATPERVENALRMEKPTRSITARSSMPPKPASVRPNFDPFAMAESSVRMDSTKTYVGTVAHEAAAMTRAGEVLREAWRRPQALAAALSIPVVEVARHALDRPGKRNFARAQFPPLPVGILIEQMGVGSQRHAVAHELCHVIFGTSDEELCQAFALGWGD